MLLSISERQLKLPGNTWEINLFLFHSNKYILPLIALDINVLCLINRAALKSELWHLGFSLHLKNKSCSHRTIFYCAAELHPTPVNISLWRFPLCNPLKHNRFICLPFRKTLSISPLTPVARVRRGGLCSVVHVHTLTFSLIVLMLRKPGPLCQRSLGQKLLCRCTVMKIRSCFDQSTCCVISALLSPQPMWAHMVPVPAVNHHSDTDECIFHIRLD